MSRISGERVSLREFRQEDISGIRSWVTDIETTKTLGGAYLRPQTWEQSEQYLSHLLSGDAGGVNLVIADKESLRYLGQCSLMMADNTARHAELAVVMCPNCQQRLKNLCPTCHHALDPAWAVCPYCTTPVGGAAQLWYLGFGERKSFGGLWTVNISHIQNGPCVKRTG